MNTPEDLRWYHRYWFVWAFFCVIIFGLIVLVNYSTQVRSTGSGEPERFDVNGTKLPMELEPTGNSVNIVMLSTVAATASWNPNPEPNISGYELRYYAVGIPPRTILTSGTMVTVADLSPATEFFFSVRAFVQGEGIPGPFSAEVPYTTATGPPIIIAGRVIGCGAVIPDVTMSITGSATQVTTTNTVGDYSFTVSANGNYTVIPTKAAILPSTGPINTIDVIAANAHYLNIRPLFGCQLESADVTGNGLVDTVDTIAIQRFIIGLASGIANTGQYKFTPPSKTYTQPISDQLNQNYSGVLLGDIML